MHLEYALLMDVAVQKTPLAKWYTHLVYYALGVCFVNGWLLYRIHRYGTHIWYTMHMEYALLMGGCCIEDTASKWYTHLVYYELGVCIVCRRLLYRRLPSKWYMYLVYHPLGVCIVNRWLLYRRHCHQNGTCIQYTMHLEYALLIDGCCIEDTAIKIVHAFSILYTWRMHC